MPQPKAPSLQFEGPFLGLNTLYDPRQLGMAFARDAHNVVFPEGRIRPRAPFLDFPGAEPGPYQVGSFYRDNSVIFPWKPAGMGAIYEKLLIQNYNGLWAVEAGKTPVHLTSALANQGPRVCFVSLGHQVAVLDALGPAWVTDGTVGRTCTLGIEMAITQPPVQWPLPVEQVDEGIDANVSYKMTWYRGLTSRPEAESIAFGLGHVLATPEQQVRFTLVESPPADAKATGWKIYRKNNTLGQVAYLLVHSENSVTPGSTWVDHYSEDSLPSCGSLETGPFAPTRNYTIKRATIGALYKNRMFFGCDDGGGRLYYTGLGEHYGYHPDDYLDVGVESVKPVSGLINWRDQLFIGKADAIWVLSGVIAGPTNLTAATGAVPPASSHALYDVGVDVGPCNYRGNGFVSVPDGAVYFAATAGFCRFDGATVRIISDLIAPTWKAFVRRKTDGKPINKFQYAIDAGSGILYIVDAGYQSDLPAGPGDVLAYHYGANRGDGTGVWSTADGVELTVHPGTTPHVTSIAFAQGALASGPALVIGNNDGFLFIAATATSDKPVPPWRYETGRISINKGNAQQVYGVEWLTATPGDVPDGGLPPVRLGFRLGNGADEHLSVANLWDSLKHRRMVGAMTTDISLVARGEGHPSGWSPGMGIIGFAIDAEMAGRT